MLVTSITAQNFVLSTGVLGKEWGQLCCVCLSWSRDPEVFMREWVSGCILDSSKPLEPDSLPERGGR